MVNAIEVSKKIEKKVADTLEPLRLEMDLMKWPAEFRAIVWGAVADAASRLAANSTKIGP